MTRIFDDPAHFSDDALAGFVAANGRYVAAVPGGVVRSTATPDGQVALVVGGGSGHYPAFAGVVGVGLAAGAVCGNVFTSPSAAQARSVARAADRGAGVLFSFGNYAGDVLHFGDAVERLAADGIEARIVLCTDDVASAPAETPELRRGIAGDFVVFKVAGAAAERGKSLDEVERLARLANANTRTLGVAFDGCTLPGAGDPLFHVPAGQMSIGLGIHGEPGIEDVPVPSASALATMLVERLLPEAPSGAGSRVGVILNGLGTVKYEELFVLYGHVSKLLDEAGLTVVDPECGELVTSLDMAGLSLTLFWLDEELEDLWRAAADAPAFRKGTMEARAQIEIVTAAEDARTVVVADGEARRVARIAATAISTALAVVEEHADELGRIDAIAGDGDHGTGMLRGLQSADAAARLAVQDGVDVAALLGAAGDAWADHAGGTSGALWGAALNALGRTLGGAAGPVDEARLGEGVAQAVAAIVARGGAQLGDKTMVDAMLPYSTALCGELAAGSPLANALAAAAAAAHAAAQSTASLRPRLGRARPLAERSLGHPDAGAVSFSLIAAALAADPTEEVSA